MHPKKTKYPMMLPTFSPYRIDVKLSFLSSAQANVFNLFTVFFTP